MGVRKRAPEPKHEDEHPSATKPGICGVTVNSGRYEWICVKPVHAQVYQGRRGLIFSENPSTEKHFFVNRYPYRKASE